MSGWLLLATALFALAAGTQLPPTTSFTHPVYLGAISTMCAASACFLRAKWLLHRFNARAAKGYCQTCGYTLSTGMHTCPECGQQRRV